MGYGALGGSEECVWPLSPERKKVQLHVHTEFFIQTRKKREKKQRFLGTLDLCISKVTEKKKWGNRIETSSGTRRWEAKTNGLTKDWISEQRDEPERQHDLCKHLATTPRHL